MKLYQIYFSPTGGTEKVVRILGGGFACEKEDIDLLRPEEDNAARCFTQEDLCLIAVPVFGGRVPAPAIQRLKRMQGNKAAAILTAVYGNRDYEDALVELKDALDGAGFRCLAAVAAIAEHSIMHAFGAGRPDAEDKKELEAFAEKIKQAFSSHTSQEELSVPGNRPYREYHGIPMKPEAGGNCTHCGKCAAQCPVHAIPPDKPQKVDREKCISCMHCISVCPVHARRNNRLLLAASVRKLRKSCEGRKENRLFL